MTLESNICHITFVKLSCRYQASGRQKHFRGGVVIGQRLWSSLETTQIKSWKIFSTSLVATCHPLAVCYCTEVLECEVCEDHRHLEITADHWCCVNMCIVCQLHEIYLATYKKSQNKHKIWSSQWPGKADQFRQPYQYECVTGGSISMAGIYK